MLIFFVTIIALSAAVPNNNVRALNTTRDSRDRQKINSLCDTPECHQAASMILANMNKSVHPCDDFYEFTCGNFMKTKNISLYESPTTVFSMVNDIIKEQQRLIETEVIKEDEPDAFKLMKSYYNICINAGKVANNSVRELREVLDKLGGWPVLEGPSWNESNFDWKKFVYEASDIGYDDDYFITLNFGVDHQNSNKPIIQITQGKTQILPIDIMNNKTSEYVELYSGNIVGAAKYLGVDVEKVKQELTDIVNFEIELVKISPEDIRQYGIAPIRERITLQQLEANFSGIPWSEYINKMLEPHTHIEPTDEIIVEVPSYLQELPKLLERTPKRTIANYALMRVIFQSFDHLGEHAYKAPRSEKCLKLTSENFDIAWSSFYIRHFFDDHTRNDTLVMTKNIRNSLMQMINQADWIDDATKHVALEKLNTTKHYAGYPNELIDDVKLNEYYKNLKLYSDSYFKTDLSMNKFKREKLLSSLMKALEETWWEFYSMKVSKATTEYTLESNSINIPAGILQGYFFNSGRPNYMNYGAIGSIIGHELTHAFDHEGGQFDKNGNKVDWWKNETKETFLEKTQCFIKQYENYNIPGTDVKIDGTYTQGENIADNGGLKAAYNAYNQWVNENVVEPHLLGLNYTARQMFWISAANVWCSNETPKHIESSVITDPHPPQRFRVIGPMSNIPEFSKDFQCPPESPMNPAKKCSVW